MVNGSWEALCGNNNWIADVAEVVCGSLGYGRSNVLTRRNLWGDSDVDITYTLMDCHSMASRLHECTLGRVGECQGSRYAGVACDTFQLNNMSLRLTNGTGPHEGRVEVSYLDRWNGLCGRKVDRTRSDVLCRSVGYDRVFAVLQHGAFGEPSNLFFDRIFCQTTDMFQKCRLSVYKDNYCIAGFGGTSISCDTHGFDVDVDADSFKDMMLSIE
ncbi:neurotrypsin-like [Lytechinus variegatus]|uniref:neurotrypsin-like n=1 Tax=Lytechinus variegatus TaxID=7654 RepID=UPI001BB143CB|nr:neurotrypsin-like [Lytechinus variegatus]